MIDHLREQKRKMAPSFVFVDPFGYSGLPVDLLSELLNYGHSEVFINFMVGYVQRFIERDGQENAMRELFGISREEVLRATTAPPSGFDTSRMSTSGNYGRRLASTTCSPSP